VLKFEQFKESNQRPRIEYVDLGSVEVLPVSELPTLSREEILESGKIPVCDDVMWLCSTTSAQGKVSYLSCDSEYIYSFNDSLSTFNRYSLGVDNMLTLNKARRLTLAESKEEPIMAQDLSSLLDEIGTESTSGGNMNQFGGGGKPPANDADTAARKSLNEKRNRVFKDTINRIKNFENTLGDTDSSMMKDSWIKNAMHIAWVTPSDARDIISVKKAKIAKTDLVLKPNQPQEIINAHAAGKTVAASCFESVYEVAATRSRPGKPTGAIVQLPKYMQGRSVNEFTQQIILQGPKDSSDTDLVLELLPISDYESKILLAGSKIQTDPRTHGGVSGVVSVVSTQRTVTKAKDKVTSRVIDIESAAQVVTSFKYNDGNMLFTESNYFPLSVYETVDIYGPDLDSELAQTMNNAYFGRAFKANARTGEVPYDSLRDEDRMNLSKDGDDISSTFISSGGGGVRFEVAEFYDSSIMRSTVELPIKKQGKGESYSFVRYNSSLVSKEGDDEYMSKCSIKSPKFAHIVEIAGEILTPAMLSRTLKKSSEDKPQRQFDAEQARMYRLAKLRGKIA